MDLLPGPGRAEEGDADLIARARAGDRDAYDRLFAAAADRVLLFARLKLGDRLRAEVDSMDVLQETYVEAHRAFPWFEDRGGDAFARWLYRIVENCIRGLADRYGARKRRRPRGTVPISQVLERVSGSATAPSMAAARAEERERLARAMERLAGDEREALLLRFFQGLAIDEIARGLGRSETATRRLLGRAAARLGGLLEGMGR